MGKREVSLQLKGILADIKLGEELQPIVKCVEMGHRYVFVIRNTLTLEIQILLLHSLSRYVAVRFNVEIL